MNTIEKAARRLAKKREQQGSRPADEAELGSAGTTPAHERSSEAPSPAGIPETPPLGPQSPAADVLSGPQTTIGGTKEPRAANNAAADLEPDVKIMEITSDLILSPEGGRSRTAEEFRMIKRPLLVNAFNRRASHEAHPNLIMISSSVQSEGKTFTSLNLAISITLELDSTVLLIDADVAKPGLSKALHIDDRPGLIDRLVDEDVELSSLLLRTDIPKLTVLPAGMRHKRSTELLASGTMRRLLDEVAIRYPDRIVLFDSPPLLETSEASVLASLMGQVVIVVESETTSQMIVNEALSQFENLDNVYLILNKCKENVFSGRYGRTSATRLFPGDRTCCHMVTILLSARFDRILSLTFPPDNSSIIGAKASTIVLTALAPIASLTSTIRCNTIIFPIGLSNILNSISLAPPPISFRILS